MPGQYDDDLFEPTKMTFGEHLEELRIALFKSVIALGVGLIFGLIFGKQVVGLIQRPVQQALERYYQDPATENLESMAREEYFVDPEEILAALWKRDPGRFPAPPEKAKPPAGEDSNSSGGAEKTDVSKAAPKVASVDRSKLVPITLWVPLAESRLVRLTTLSAQEAFMVWMKAALILALILSSPAIFYFLWSFVAAGLYPHEKKYVHVFLPFSLGLFIAGVALAFFFVFRYVLDFLFGINKWLEIDPDIRISEWIGFVLIMPIGFGLAFQLPLVMLFLERIGVFSVESYMSKWRIAVLVIAVLSMILTPADPMSMMLMAVPLVFLYFGGIGLCKFLPRRQSTFEAA